MNKEPCSNCGRTFGGSAVYTCNVCQQQFCIDCVTFTAASKGQPAPTVECWIHAGVGGAAAHQRRLKGAADADTRRA